MITTGTIIEKPQENQPEKIGFWSKYLVQFPNVWTFIFFLVAGAVQTYPLIFNLRNALVSTFDPADSAWRIGSFARNLLNNPVQLYQTNAFYGVPNGLALDELLTGNAILVAPLVWLTNDPVLALNLLIYGNYALSGFAMFMLVRKLTSSVGAGYVAGIIFSFSPWHMGHIGHVGVAAQQWMIFALYFLILFLELNPLNRKALLYLGLFTLLFALQILAGGYHAYFAAILFAFYLLYHYFFRSGTGAWLRAKLGRKPDNPNFSWNTIAKQIGLLAVSAVLVLAMVLPFVIPFMEAQKAYGFKRDLASDVYYWSATPSSLLRTTPNSWLYRPVQGGIFGAQTASERALYPGVTVVILALIGLVFGRTDDGRRWLFGFIALFGLVLAFGPYLKWDEFDKTPDNLFKLPYAYLYNLIPGFDALRVPLRFGQLLMLGLAVVAGFGVLALQNKFKAKKFAPLMVGLIGLTLVTVDFIAPGWRMEQIKQADGAWLCSGERTPEYVCLSVRTGNEAPPLYRWLAQEPESLQLVPKSALMVELPVNQPVVNSNPLYMLQSYFHQRPMLNGSANILPTGYVNLFNELDGFPSDRTLDVIEGLGVQFIIAHREGLTPKADADLDKAIANGRLAVVKQFGNDYVLKVNPSSRADEVRKLVPQGAEIYLGEAERYKSLYNHAFAGLLGKDYRYFAPTENVYSKLLGIKLAEPRAEYPYALLYKQANPNDFGFNEAQLIWENEVVKLYRR